jgi:hypothetical protein
MAAIEEQQQKATTMTLRGMLALWLGRLKVYLSISINQ